MNRATSILLALGIASAAQAQDINTFSSWNGTDFISFGEASTPTIGQVFFPTVNQTLLESFTFALSNTSSDPVIFSFHIAPWDVNNARLGGTILTSQGPVSLPASVTSFTALTFFTPGVVLIPDSFYVAFLTSSLHHDSAPDTGAFAFTQTDPVSTGGAVGINNGADFGSLSTSSWNTGGNDLAFQATFTPIPEPASAATISALAVAVVCVTGARRRRSAVTQA